MNTVEQRLEDFVAAFGDVTAGARKLPDYEARGHSDIWIQRLIGEGISCHYVIGYQLEDRWWTFCFDHRDDEWTDPSREQLWVIEAYTSGAESWREAFLYSIPVSLWLRVPKHDPRSAFARSKGVQHRRELAGTK